MILLDTHIFLWIMEGHNTIIKNKKLVELINKLIPKQEILVSEISTWEIAMLESKGRIHFSVLLEEWLELVIHVPGIQCINLSPKIISDSVNFIGQFHSDPSDKLIVASSRVLGAMLITKDKEIIKYGKKGYVKVFNFK